MRASGIALTLCLLLGLSACGSSGDSSTSNPSVEAGHQRAGQCAPTSVAADFERLLERVSGRRQQLALQSIARGHSLLRITIFHGAGAGEGRVDAETPLAVYESFAETVPKGATTTLLAAGVGSDAPFAVDYERSHPGSRTAGIEFIVKVGSEFLTGKVGIDCGTGDLYVGAMNLVPSIGGRQLCGRYIKADAQKRVVCRI
jgi:hypothetical protein